MEGGGRIPGTENRAQFHGTGTNAKFGTRRQTLVDLSNIIREDRSSGIPEKSYAEVLKENAQLMKFIGEKSKQIEVYEKEVEKLKIALQGAQQQNWQLAESNSQMLAELNLGKDRLKNIQHELKCTTLVLEQKKLELQDKQKMNKQLQQQIKAQGKSVDLATESVGGKRKKTDSESNIQIAGQVNHEAPRRRLDDRKPLRRQSIAKPPTISSSNVQSVKSASCSGSGVALHEDGRKSTRRTSIKPNSVFHVEEATNDSSKLVEDKKVDTDLDTTIPNLTIKREPEITEPSLTLKEMTDDDSAVSLLNSSVLSTEQQVAADAMDGPCLSIVPVATAQLTTQDVTQEPPMQKLGDSTAVTVDSANGPYPSEEPAETVPVDSAYGPCPTAKPAETVPADSGNGSHPSEVPAVTVPLTAQDVQQEAPRQKLGGRKPMRRRSIATVHTVSSSQVQSVKATSCSLSNVPLHEEGRKSTRRRSMIPSNMTQMEETTTQSCKTMEHNSIISEHDNRISISTVKSEPNTEHETNYGIIKEESTEISDSSIVLMKRGATDTISGARPSLAAARRSSLSRPLPLRRAVEKVASYREQPVNVKMRRVD